MSASVFFRRTAQVWQFLDGSDLGDAHLPGSDSRVTGARDLSTRRAAAAVMPSRIVSCRMVTTVPARILRLPDAGESRSGPADLSTKATILPTRAVARERPHARLNDGRPLVGSPAFEVVRHTPDLDASVVPGWGRHWPMRSREDIAKCPIREPGVE